MSSVISFRSLCAKYPDLALDLPRVLPRGTSMDAPCSLYVDAKLGADKASIQRPSTLLKGAALFDTGASRVLVVNGYVRLVAGPVRKDDKGQVLAPSVFVPNDDRSVTAE